MTDKRFLSSFLFLFLFLGDGAAINHPVFPYLPLQTNKAKKIDDVTMMQQTFSFLDLSVDRFMTLASSPLSSLSSLSAASSSYLESLAPNLPVSVQATAHQFATAAAYYKTQAPPPLDHLALLFETYVLASPTTVAVTFLTLILTVVAMSWRNPLDMWRGRSSPYGKSSSSQPQVSDSDFSYLTTNDIEEPQHAYDPSYVPHHSPRLHDNDDLAPDIITLKHKGVTYPLHFPAYAIGDGLITIGDLRIKAARATGCSDPRRVKLLYKGRSLKDNSKPAKAEGLKQESEMMCVVSEPMPDGSVSTTSSESDLSRIPTQEIPDRSPKSKKKSRGKKKKGSNKGKGQEDSPNLAPPMEPPSRPSSAGISGHPSPSPSLNSFKTARDKLDALATYWRTTLVPSCEEYISDPPTDPKIRDYQRKLLDETTMTQVILKADGIDLDGDDVTRAKRKALIREIHQMTTKLDEAARQ